MQMVSNQRETPQERFIVASTAYLNSLCLRTAPLAVCVYCTVVRMLRLEWRRGFRTRRQLLARNWEAQGVQQHRSSWQHKSSVWARQHYSSEASARLRIGIEAADCLLPVWSHSSPFRAISFSPCIPFYSVFATTVLMKTSVPCFSFA